MLSLSAIGLWPEPVHADAKAPGCTREGGKKKDGFSWNGTHDAAPDGAQEISFCSTFSIKMSPRTGLEKPDRPES
jgi:hypothetical protein